MRTGLFIRGRTLDDPQSKALWEGLKAAGCNPVIRSASSYLQGQVERNLDAVAVCGQRSAEGLITRDYAAKGIPSIILDLGYVRRASLGNDAGFFQLSIGHLGWLPTGPCPLDRWRALGVPFPTYVPKPKTAPVLICGQVEGDASHGLSVETLARHYRALVARYGACGTRPILFKPHPLSDRLKGGYGEDAVVVGDIRAAVEKAGLVVSYGSTAGLDAILAGTPASVVGPAIYAGIASRPGDPGEGVFPSPFALRGFLSRLAYAQWTLEEIASGQAIRFLRSTGELP